MCLSTAYEVSGGNEKFIADRITNIEIDGPTVRLTTLLGTQTEVTGELKSIDLNKNVILIATQQ